MQELAKARHVQATLVAFHLSILEGQATLQPPFTGFDPHEDGKTCIILVHLLRCFDVFVCHELRQDEVGTDRREGRFWLPRGVDRVGRPMLSMGRLTSFQKRTRTGQLGSRSSLLTDWSSKVVHQECIAKCTKAYEDIFWRDASDSCLLGLEIPKRGILT